MSVSAGVVWAVSAVLCLALLTERWWAPRLEVSARRGEARPWGWWLAGYPLTVARMRLTWRRLCDVAGLSVVKRPRYLLVSRSHYVAGRSLRASVPVLGVARPTRAGLTVRVRLHPGQTPAVVEDAADALAHAWRMHAVRVSSPQRGQVVLRAVRHDPLAVAGTGLPPAARGELAVAVGWLEDGRAWVLDFRTVPHWLIVGATQSGKSTLLAALVRGLASRDVALVGLDLKGGLELSPFQERLSALATTRAEAVELLDALVDEARWRMSVCRAAGVRSVWALPEDERPLGLVVLVDELAELFLADGSATGRKTVAEGTVLLIRLAQLGAALGVHLVVAGQRVGAELGPGVTMLRAQLGGRVCLRVHDEQTAEMVLGDVHPAAVSVAQTIAEDTPGVAVATVGGGWMRARSGLVTVEDARAAALRYAHRTPDLSAVTARGSGPGAAPGGGVRDG